MTSYRTAQPDNHWTMQAAYIEPPLSPSVECIELMDIGRAARMVAQYCWLLASCRGHGRPIIFGTGPTASLISYFDPETTDAPPILGERLAGAADHRA